MYDWTKVETEKGYPKINGIHAVFLSESGRSSFTLNDPERRQAVRVPLFRQLAEPRRIATLLQSEIDTYSRTRKPTTFTAPISSTFHVTVF